MIVASLGRTHMWRLPVRGVHGYPVTFPWPDTIRIAGPSTTTLQTALIYGMAIFEVAIAKSIGRAMGHIWPQNPSPPLNARQLSMCHYSRPSRRAGLARIHAPSGPIV